MIVAYATPVTLALGGPDDPFLFGVFNEIATAQVKVYVYNYNDPIRLISCDDGWVFSGGHWWVPNRSFPRCGAYEKLSYSHPIGVLLLHSTNVRLIANIVTMSLNYVHNV